MTTMPPRTQRYWEDVKEGDELHGFSMKLGWTTMAKHVSGSQDFYEVHHDPDYAREADHTGIFYNTGFTSGYLSRLLTDWVGPEGWVKKLEYQMRRMNMNGDTIQVLGRVLGKREVPGGPNATAVSRLGGPRFRLDWALGHAEGGRSPKSALMLPPVHRRCRWQS